MGVVKTLRHNSSPAVFSRATHKHITFFLFFEAPLFHKGASSMSKCGYVCVYRRLFEGRLAKLVEVSNCLYLTQFLTDFVQILDSNSYDQT